MKTGLTPKFNCPDCGKELEFRQLKDEWKKRRIIKLFCRECGKPHERAIPWDQIPDEKRVGFKANHGDTLRNIVQHP